MIVQTETEKERLKVEKADLRVSAISVINMVNGRKLVKASELYKLHFHGTPL